MLHFSQRSYIIYLHSKEKRKFNECYVFKVFRSNRCRYKRQRFRMLLLGKNDPNDNIHLHACCEILFCLSGGKSFFINDRIYEVQDGDVFVMNQFEAHRITPYDNIPFRRYVLQIHPEFLYENSTRKQTSAIALM